jgi:DNA repair protein SbcC/Rad50
LSGIFSIRFAGYHVRITRVVLDNIKSYRHASIPLGLGTVAVRGHNGAGKSTLVEAIGYALFDALSYNQAQFVREGEKYGTVTVTFISSLDDREYHVFRRCGSSPTWYVHDPELGARVVEQHTDVKDFLRRHMRIETNIALDDLFNDAIGIPQGTFTADFLLTPTNRKKKFDILLQVEEYRKAFDNLAPTRTYLQDQRRLTDKRIDDLARETDQLDGWRDQLAAGRARERALVADLDRLQREAGAAEATREALRRRQDEVTRLEGAAQVAQAAFAAADARLRDAAAQRDEARAAQAVCEAARPGSDAHRAAQAQLAAARARQAERDELLRERAEAALRLEGDTRDLANARARLREAEAAAEHVVSLAPNVARQAERELARERANVELQRLDTLRRDLARIEGERARLDSDLAASERQIAALEALRPEAELLEQRSQRLLMLQDQRAQRAARTPRLRAIAAEQTEATAQREKAVRLEAKHGENVRKIRANAALAEEAPTLEAAHTRASAEIGRIEARQDQLRTSRAQSGGGDCPFLGEPCLNIQRKGLPNLNAYFDRLIAQDDQLLLPLRAQLDESAERLDKARTARDYYGRLGEYEDAQRAAAEQRSAADARLSRLAEERAELDAFLRAAPAEADLAAAQAEFKRSDDADKRLRALEPLRAERARLTASRETLLRDGAQLNEQAATLASVPATLAQIEADLTALGDPRSQSAAAEQLARERPERAAAMEQLARAVTSGQAQLAALDERLRPFAGLDAELRALHEQAERTASDHTRFLQHQQTAAKLPERQRAYEAAAAEATSAAHARDTAEAAHARARADFDPDALTAAIQRADALGAARGHATADLRHTQDDCLRLQGEIARVEALLDDLRAERAERDTLDDLERMLQQFRETIREAGPSIMKALLRQISGEANRIFGDIMGDRAAQLSWESDYEIVLRRDGKERSFAQLSGGEQMSAALAVRLALLRSLTRLDIAFFDEPTQNMDGERRGNLAEQIRRVRGFDQLLVISHDDTFEQGLDCVLHLEKRHGETILVEEDALVSA